MRPAGGGSVTTFPTITTDASGFFTVTVSSLPAGIYDIRVAGPKYLAKVGSVTLTGAPSASVSLGLMKAGDASNDNAVGAIDASIVRASFGKSAGDPGYDARADFNRDDTVNVLDLTLLQGNFGLSGAAPLSP
jgi:hypothetical protein